MSSPPKRGAGALMTDANRGKHVKKKMYSKALFTESIFPEKSPRPQSSYTARDRKNAHAQRQNNYMKTLSTSIKFSGKNNNSGWDTTGGACSTKNVQSPGQKGHKGFKGLMQRQKFRDATTGRFKGAYFGGLRYAGSVSHGMGWK